MDTKLLLQKQKSVLLERLAILACEDRTEEKAALYRKKAKDILRDFALADQALSSIAVLAATEFSSSERPIDAIIAYLDKSGHPTRQSDLIEGIISGGFRSDDPKGRLIVLRSIDNHLSGTGARKQLIKSVNGLIGRCDWEDSRFQGGS